MLMNVLLIIYLIDVLRKLCADGLPTVNYFELCAFYLLEYEKLMKDNNIRTKSLKELVNTAAKQTQEIKLEEGEKNNKKYTNKNANEIIPKNKV
jgi:hypothetical protein